MQFMLNFTFVQSLTVAKLYGVIRAKESGRADERVACMWRNNMQTARVKRMLTNNYNYFIILQFLTVSCYCH